MKKRKAPIIPIMVLVVLVLAISGINAMRAPAGAEQAMPAEPPVAPQRELTAQEKQAERDRVADAAQSALRQGEKMPPEMRGGPPGGPGSSPAVQAPRFEPQPPTPSASNTSQQWWQDESGIEKVTDAN